MSLPILRFLACEITFVYSKSTKGYYFTAPPSAAFRRRGSGEQTLGIKVNVHPGWRDLRDFVEGLNGGAVGRNGGGGKE